MIADPISPFEAAESLLSKSRERSSSFLLHSMPSGGNNKVFKVETSKRSFLLKQYYIDKSDTRNRLMAEWSFLSEATRNQIPQVPKAYAVDHLNGYALYEFIEGRKLSKQELKREHIDSAVNFMESLNSDPQHKFSNLADASEARFSIIGHLKLLESRINTLILNSTESFDLLNKIQLYFEKLSEVTLRSMHEFGIPIDDELKKHERCVSPSDFGFHNALITSQNELVFIDFEYAGWDDPAKTCADFVLQPEVKIAPNYFEILLNVLAPEAIPRIVFRKRALALKPIFALKWVCIILNCFVPDWFARQRFANSEIDPHAFKIQQLKKAEAFFLDLPELS